MDEEFTAEEFSIGSLAEIVDEDSSRRMQYRESNRDDG
jgi:hypothetical protein